MNDTIALARLSRLLGVATAILLAFTMPALAADKSIELILDASGSMNGKLAGGEAKIAAAKTAVADLAAGISGDVALSFRAYGRQWSRSEKNCNDTSLLVPFGSADAVRAEVATTAAGLVAQGYTPITKVLGLAADDLKSAEGKRTIILVSDGKEPCAGDPCLTARKLAAADADLVIHTIGFDVDAQAKYQLQCVARVARGQYFDAASAGDLAKTLKEASEAKVETEAIVVARKPKPGKLAVLEPGFHVVTDAETGEKVGVVNRDHPEITLPAGLYNVAFDKLVWKSVEVRPEETTTLTPARIRIERSQFHTLLDPETGEAVATISNDTDEIAFVPGVFDVTFDKAVWRGVELKAGETTVLNPAGIRADPIPPGAWYSVFDAEGKVVGGLRPGSEMSNFVLLPPGDYTVEIDGEKVPVTLSEGKIAELKLQ